MPVRIVVHADGADERALAEATRMVSADLRGRGVAVEPAVREAPPGSKGTVTDISVLVLTSLLSAGTITALSRVLVARIKAGTATKFVITDGDRSLQVNNNTSAEETQLLLEKFNRTDA